jgi:hypothetical protein
VNLKPIETTYMGYKFRSRLEAKWAVFFDALGIAWEYEFEGFVLRDGTWYLPDFWLPTFDGGMWAEVKPSGGDFQTARQFAYDAERAMWLCEGVPAIRAYRYILLMPSGDLEGPRDLAECIGIPNADQAEGENRMFVWPGYEEADLSIAPHNSSMLGSTFLGAVEAARGARFEHLSHAG